MTARQPQLGYTVTPHLLLAQVCNCLEVQQVVGRRSLAKGIDVETCHSRIFVHAQVRPAARHGRHYVASGVDAAWLGHIGDLLLILCSAVVGPVLQRLQ